MNLEKAKKKIFYSTLATFFLGILFASPAFATTPISRASGIQVLHAASVNSYAIPLDGPAPVGGVPFCHSGSLGTIICYTGSFLRTAYNFPPEGEGAPSTPGVPRALDGTGSTIVIVDAYGSPTITGDLPYYDGVVGIPAPPSFTVVCENGQPSPENSPCINWESPPHPECNPGSWVGETTLDVEMSHSLAPGAKIVLVEANSCYDSDLYAAEMAVVSNSTYAGSIMSQSFGEPDDLAACTTLNNAGTACIAWNYNLLDLPNSVFNLALLKGWTVLASSGDYGANEDICALSCANTQLDPAFPATSPDVLATGGTQGKAYGGQYGWVTPPEGTFTCAADTNCNTGLVWINGGTNGCTTASRPGLPTSCYPTHYGGEAAWNEFKTLGASTNIGYTTGGGVSTIYPRPTYQTNLPSYTKTLKGVTVHTVGRLVPDVSFNAAVNGGFLAYAEALGGWVVFGGTSAASPAWAAIIALLNQAHGRPVGFLNTAIYRLAQTSMRSSAFHDITAGENSVTAGLYHIDGFSAGRGYDLATGWGTPNVSNFITDILPYTS